MQDVNDQGVLIRQLSIQINQCHLEPIGSSALNRIIDQRIGIRILGNLEPSFPMVSKRIRHSAPMIQSHPSMPPSQKIPCCIARSFHEHRPNHSQTPNESSFHKLNRQTDHCSIPRRFPCPAPEAGSYPKRPPMIDLAVSR